MPLVEYDEVIEFADWQATKSKLKFNAPPAFSFPILGNCIYWAHLGCNIGSEEGKHRPILVTRTTQKSPVCTIIPLTTQRLNDGYWFHIDLENLDSTALVEQMRVIDKRRIDKPMRSGGKITSISEKDWKDINNQIRSIYMLKPLSIDK